jgi:UDP-N-acetylglucosamine acyltransferase
MPKVHPTAIVHASAQLAEDVEVGPYCVIESDVSIGPRCVLRAGAAVRRYTTMGADNVVDTGCVLGGEPQDLKFSPSTVSYLRIGEGNVFREHVTISRATTPGNATVVGDRTYWMAGAHAGHDSTVESDAILVNGSAIAGHATVGRGAILSAHGVVHQFCWVGERVMVRGNGGATMHVPPYVMIANMNQVVGLNVVGLRRAKDITDQDRAQIKEAFGITYRSGLPMTKALVRMDACQDWGEAALRFREFVRRVLAAKKPYNRGLIPFRSRTGADPGE